MWKKLFAVLILGVLAWPAVALAGEPFHVPPMRFTIVHGNFVVVPAPSPSNPVGANQVLVKSWDTANLASVNALALYLGSGDGGGSSNPSNSDQVLTRVWNSANNAIAAYIVGVGPGGFPRLDQVLNMGANKSFPNANYTLAFTSTDTGVAHPITFTNTVATGPTVGNESVGVFIENNRTSTSADQSVVTGLEAVARSRGAGAELTVRGANIRTYVDDSLGGTAITSVGIDGSVRTSGAVVAAAGTAFVGIRSYMAPGFTPGTLANVTNNHAFWGYNESATQAITNGFYLSDGGGGFTYGINFSGTTIGTGDIKFHDGTVQSTAATPFQTNTSNNTSQTGLNFLTSTANAVGLTVTPTNAGGTNTEKFEVTGSSYTGNAATATVSASQVSATMFSIGLNRGANAAPAFATNHYTVTGTSWTEGSGSIVATDQNGANSFYSATPIVPVSGQTYQIDVPVTSWTSGTLVISFGGASSPTVTVAANTTYRFYLTATSGSGNLTVTGSAHAAMTITNLLCERAAYDATSGANVNIIIGTNSGLTVPLVVYQPIATAGWTFEEYVIAAYAVVVKTANGTDTWEWGASTYTATLTFAATRQTFLTLVCFATGYWDIAGINGSVTPA